MAGHGLADGSTLQDQDLDALLALGDPQVDLTVAVVASVALLVAAVLAAIVPARQAASITPVDALRSE